jgi:hypothetical protein
MLISSRLVDQRERQQSFAINVPPNWTSTLKSNEESSWERGIIYQRYKLRNANSVLAQTIILEDWNSHFNFKSAETALNNEYKFLPSNKEHLNYKNRKDTALNVWCKSIIIFRRCFPWWYTIIGGHEKQSTHTYPTPSITSGLNRML